MYTVRVWDLPTRFFHWLLVASVLGQLVSVQLGAMQWHFRFGYLVLSLLLFRLAWGLVGGYWSRFARFLPGPATLNAYLRGQAPPHWRVGHNPLGALSVWAILLLLLAQVGTGLFADDEIATQGPLSHLASSAWVQLASFYHTKIGKFLVLAWVLVHVSAILWHRWAKAEDLITPMWRGDKQLDWEAPSSADQFRPRLLALVLWLAAGALVALLLYSASRTP